METAESVVGRKIYHWVSHHDLPLQKGCGPSQGRGLVPLERNLAEPTSCGTRSGLAGWRTAKVRGSFVKCSLGGTKCIRFAKENQAYKPDLGSLGVDYTGAMLSFREETSQGF